MKNIQEFIPTKFGDIFISSYIVDDTGPVLIIIPSVGWFHTGPNRNFIELANFCGRRNINTIVFDYIGQGDSSQSCHDQNLLILSESFRFVYNYILNKCPNQNLVLLGYGIGNLILALHLDEISCSKSIFYLPEFDYKLYLPKEHDDFVKDGMIDYSMDVFAGTRYPFYKAIFGPIHDSTYNPISMNIVNDISALPTDLLKSKINNSNSLIISDNQRGYEFDKVNFWYIKEFDENKFPSDWYKTINKQPETFEKVHHEIALWISNQLLNKENSGSDRKEKSVDISYNNECVKKIFPFMSGDNLLYGILHDNLDNPFSKKPLLVFVPGVGGDKVNQYSTGPRLGEYLARRGIRFYRYDNRFGGGSINTLSGYNWTDVIEDTANAINSLSSIVKISNLYLVAWSAGIKIISYLSPKISENISGCYLWNPIFKDKPQKRDTYDYVMPKYFKNIDGELVTQAGGESLGLKYVTDGKKYDFKKEFIDITFPIDILWGSKDAYSEDHQFILNCANVQQQQIIESTHHLFSYNTMETIFEKTYQWIMREEEKRAVKS